MSHRPEIPEALALHIRSAGRPSAESRRLLQTLTTALWPGGADRTEPVARGWLRMWGPQRVVIDPPHCGCAEGRCAICN